jgi:predicted nucleotidyltransferase
MISKEEILSALAKDKPELERRYKVRKLSLFGSYARGEQRADSDVDILVEVDPSIGLDFVTLAERIEKLLGVGVDLEIIWQILRKDLPELRTSLSQI